MQDHRCGSYTKCKSRRSILDFDDWEGTDEGLPAAIAVSFPFKQPEDGQELLALLRQLRRHPLDATGLTLERAAF